MSSDSNKVKTKMSSYLAQLLDPLGIIAPEVLTEKTCVAEQTAFRF